MKRKVKICVDISMYVIFLYLMSYRAGRGLFLHGIWGCILFLLFLLHHILNLRWYKGLHKGKYNASRVFFNGIDLLLFAAMLVMAVSSVMMSGDVFSFSPFYQTQTARMLHTSSTAWGFVLMLLHVGLHTHGPLKKLRKKAKDSIFSYAFDLAFVLLLGAGMYCFVRSDLWKGMLMIRKGSPAFSSLSFYGEYLLITIAFCLFVHVLMSALQRCRRK